MAESVHTHLMFQNGRVESRVVVYEASVATGFSSTSVDVLY